MLSESGPFVGQAPGKLILCGEHAVVDGHSAIAAAIPRFTTVTLRPRPGPSTLAEAPHRLVTDDPRLLPALLTVLPAEGLEIGITSELPIGCGLGSSAALAIASLRALAAMEGRTMGFDELHARGFAVERAFHGTPSGVDHAVSALGGVVRYRRERGGDGATIARIEALKLEVPLSLVLVNTGTPSRTTAEMVAGVRARGCAKELAAIGVIVEGVARHLGGDGDVTAIGRLLDANHTLLQAIGVSTPALDRACAVMRSAGALGAKLAGAGGGGVAFGLCAPWSHETILASVRDAGFSATDSFLCTVGHVSTAGSTGAFG